MTAIRTNPRIPGPATGDAGKALVVDGTLRYALAAIEGGGAGSGTEFPENPSQGELFYRTDRSVLYQYDGTGWAPLVAESDIDLYLSSSGSDDNDGHSPQQAFYTLERTLAEIPVVIGGKKGVTVHVNGTCQSDTGNEVHDLMLTPRVFVNGGRIEFKGSWSVVEENVALGSADGRWTVKRASGEFTGSLRGAFAVNASYDIDADIAYHASAPILGNGAAVLDWCWSPYVGTDIDIITLNDGIVFYDEGYADKLIVTCQNVTFTDLKFGHLCGNNMVILDGASGVLLRRCVFDGGAYHLDYTYGEPGVPYCYSPLVLRGGASACLVAVNIDCYDPVYERGQGIDALLVEDGSTAIVSSVAVQGAMCSAGIAVRTGSVVRGGLSDVERPFPDTASRKASGTMRVSIAGHDVDGLVCCADDGVMQNVTVHVDDANKCKMRVDGIVGRKTWAALGYAFKG